MDLLLLVIVHLFVLSVLVLISLRYPMAIVLLVAYLLLYWKTYLFVFYLIVFTWSTLTSLPSYERYKDAIHQFFSFWGVDPIPTSEEQVIYVANYPKGILGYLYINLLDNVTLLGRRFTQVGRLSKLSQLMYNDSNYIQVDSRGGNYSSVLEKVRERAGSIFGYAENLRYRQDPYQLTPLRKGLFAMARELNRPVVPIVFDHLTSTSYFFVPSNLKIYCGPTFYPQDYETTEKLMKEVEEWMSTKLTELKSSRTT